MSLKEGLEDKGIIEIISKRLPENLKRSFLEGYLFARFSLWDRFTIKETNYGDIIFSFWINKEDYPCSKAFLQNFLLRQLKDFCIGLYMFLHKVPTKRRILFKHSFGEGHIKKKKSENFENLDSPFKSSLIKMYVLNISVCDKKAIATEAEVLNYILTYWHNLAVAKSEKCMTVKAIKKGSYFPFYEIYSFYPEKLEAFLENPPESFLEIKNKLVKEGIITKNYFLRPGKTISDLKRSLNQLLKTKCPICGSDFIKDNKSKTTCGHPNCKVLKSRLKKKMAPYVGLSKEDFCKKLVEVDKKRLEINNRRGRNAQKIANLPQLADILYNELIA